MDRDRISGNKNAAVGIGTSITSRYTGRKPKKVIPDDSCSSGR